jgi:Ca2+-binding EF-hand superfamily protein
MLVELKECFLEAYDDNQDGRIDIREVRMCHFALHESNSPK